MNTVCYNQLTVESLFSQEIIADFEGGCITLKAGGLLLRELDQRYRITETAVACLHDPRDSGKVKQELLTLVRQRLFAIALGYEDNNDAAWLAKDPAVKITTGKAPESSSDLASPPTLCHFENRVTTKDLRRLSGWLLDLYLKTHPGPCKVIVLDMDATDFPLAAVLHPGNIHSSHGALAVLKRLIKKLKPDFLSQKQLKKYAFTDHDKSFTSS